MFKNIGNIFFWVFISCFALSKNLLAYPNFISYGYQSCMSCHYNPFGNGPLTDYGRAVGASAISDKMFLDEHVSDEKIAERSGFFFQAPSNSWLRPSFNLRDLYLVSAVGTRSSSSRLISMDLSASLVILPPDFSQLLIVGQMAHASKPYGQVNNDEASYRSREHYVGYRLSKAIGLYVGLMDKVFGIRIPDHTSYSRTLTRHGQNDQTHGALLHYVTKTYELGVQPFLGNFAQDENLRQKGITSSFNFITSKKSRVGASLLSSSSHYRKFLMYAMHSSIGFEEGNSLLIEGGGVRQTVISTQQSTNSVYGMAQGHYLFRRGLFGICSFDYSRPDTFLEVDQIRIGPGLQFFPIQRIELLLSAYNTTISSSTNQKNYWDLLAQFHLWL
ncbi:MAG: hypothetical protein KA436_04755 [Oligoflexales bacterium]|nr:hypothetical protein [Oligoflexales bacterium]